MTSIPCLECVTTPGGRAALTFPRHSGTGTTSHHAAPERAQGDANKVRAVLYRVCLVATRSRRSRRRVGLHGNLTIQTTLPAHSGHPRPCRTLQRGFLEADVARRRSISVGRTAGVQTEPTFAPSLWVADCVHEISSELIPHFMISVLSHAFSRRLGRKPVLSGTDVDFSPRFSYE